MVSSSSEWGEGGSATAACTCGKSSRPHRGCAKAKRNDRRRERDHCVPGICAFCFCPLWLFAVAYVSLPYWLLVADCQFTGEIYWWKYVPYNAVFPTSFSFLLLVFPSPQTCKITCNRKSSSWSSSTIVHHHHPPPSSSFPSSIAPSSSRPPFPRRFPPSSYSCCWCWPCGVGHLSSCARVRRDGEEWRRWDREARAGRDEEEALKEEPVGGRNWR